MKSYKLFFGLALGISTIAMVACSVGGGSNLAINTLGWSNEVPQNDLFKEYVGNFPQAKFPMQLDEKSIAFFRPKANWSSDKMQSQEPSWKKRLVADKFEKFIPQMSKGRFSRVPIHHEVQYVAKLAETSQFVAVVYSIATFYGNYDYSEPGDAPVRLMLSTYNHKGEIIDEKNIAYSDRMSIATAIIEKNLKIKTKRFEKVYEKDEYGNDTEVATNKTIKSEITYQISKNGTIETVGGSKAKDKESKDRTDYVF